MPRKMVMSTEHKLDEKRLLLWPLMLLLLLLLVLGIFYHSIPGSLHVKTYETLRGMCKKGESCCQMTRRLYISALCDTHARWSEEDIMRRHLEVTRAIKLGRENNSNVQSSTCKAFSLGEPRELKELLLLLKVTHGTVSEREIGKGWEGKRIGRRK